MSGFDDGPGAEMWELFEQESEDYLGQIESLLSGSAADLMNPETMSALFRAMHSLKGVSASLGLTGIELVAHHAEDLLDLFRNGEAQPDEATRDLLLQTADTLIEIREACVADHVDAPADMQLVSQLSGAKAQLKSGGTVAPMQQAVPPITTPEPVMAPTPAPEPVVAPEPSVPPPPPPSPPAPPLEASSEEEAAPSGQMSMQVSQEPADPSEAEFQPSTVEPFAEVVKSELGQLAEALESPELESLDMQGISSSIFAIREVANDVGYLGISAVLDEIADQLRDAERLDKTELTRGLCLFVHRLRVLSELAGAGISMEDVDDSMSPHISKEARDVVDRLSVGGGASRDWELVGVLARALGVMRISALARLASELTIQDGWRERPGAMDVLDEIRRESQVIGIEGLNVSSLDMRRETYDRLRDQMALLLTNAEAAVAELRTSLGDEIFNSLSPAARQQIADFLKEPNAKLLEIQAMLPDGPDYTMQVMARIDQERVMSNRVLVDIDPDLYQFLIGVSGSPEPLMMSLQGIGGASQAIQSWNVLASNAVQSAPAAPQAQPAPPQPSPQPAAAPAAEEAANVMHIGDDWTVGQSAPQRPVPPSPQATPPQPAPAAASAQPAAAQQSQLQPVAQDSNVPAERTEGGAPSRNVGGGSLRVSSELVDNYLDTVAELRLCISRIEQGASEAGFASTIAELRSVAKQTGARKAERLNLAASHIDEAGKVLANQIAKAETTLRMLHSVTLQLRVVPISIVLGRMPRLVRDLSRSLGKQVNLEIEDGDIQIDKSMVDALMEPLVHMIRNAMDHGIEGAEERVQAGKPEKATLTLEATQNGNVAQIMIADDGRGLNTSRIRGKAIERGLISDQDASRMSEREIQRLIFAPGFSTAAAVTETSGRGVGMDVVLTTIRRLGGAIDIDSVEGEGTKFYLSFPVSAALQRIVVVTDGERDLGLPERAIVEVIEVRRSAIQEVGELAGIQHRDGFLPVRSIETMLGWETPEEAASQSAMPVVIIGTPQRRVGVAVSRVKRRQEVFMKELHPALNAVDVLAGATVMGEGQPLLVLDPETLIAIAGG
ncbi:Hpt domain-containing protein [Nisaea acidiphila]|uniref:Chemotaxis protein CheA n=1 Tax=Nisaea acidiphila TaxID=1862145 RepID=A0A9J7AWR4_9PROT|nr:Hpt domain-containing protein [Nisaea acidiphila]UUX50692.1 Hpt domain-containing protein [Nisaea acidiphila]